MLDVITRCHSRRKEAITNRGEKPVKKHWLSSHKTNKSLSLGNAPGFAGRAFPQPLSVLWDKKLRRSSRGAPWLPCARGVLQFLQLSNYRQGLWRPLCASSWATLTQKLTAMWEQGKMEYLELGNQLNHLAVTHEGPGQCPSSGAAAAATGREVLLVLFSTATDDSRDLIPASFQCFLTKHGELIPSGSGTITCQHVAFPKTQEESSAVPAARSGLSTTLDHILAFTRLPKGSGQAHRPSSCSPEAVLPVLRSTSHSKRR